MAEGGADSDSLPSPSSIANTLHLQKITLPPIRTYKSDVSEAVKRGQESTASIFSAEEARRHEGGGGGSGTPREGFILGFRSKTSAFAVLFGVALLALGAGFFAFVLLQKNAPPQITPAARALVFVNKETKINIGNFDRADIEKQVLAAQKEAVAFNNMMAITFIREHVLEEGGAVQEEVLDISEVLPLLASEMPPGFTRALDNEYLYGVYSVEGNMPFLIMKVRSYENAFAALLEWEKTMAILRDFKILLGVNRFPPPAVMEFADILIRNRDVRTVYDEEKKPILYYSFVDKETLVFTTDKTTFDEILNRLATPKRTLR